MDVNRSVISGIIITLLVTFAVFISSAAIAGARGGTGYGMPVGAMTKPIQGVGTQISPMTTVQQGGQVAYSGNSMSTYTAGQQQILPGQIRTYGGGMPAGNSAGVNPGITPSIPIPPPVTYAQQQVQPFQAGGAQTGSNTGFVGYQNTPVQTGAGNILTPEKVEAGSENVRRVSSDSLLPVTGGQYANPLQPAQQPYDASLLRGTNSNDRKGGRYLGQYP